MKYEDLFDLKYNKGLSTYELVRRFPEDLRQVNEVALLDIPEATLEEVLQEKLVLKRLKKLKKKFLE
ncbi:MAG: hypothetical protein PHN49_00950 [Candidatus Omnitrophica bacterium]|nr:hypothetical protein [Candidatus Omnitrophota bacterium]MDD5670191.1 hypothetical protein [Candidatus Omnitrophota bacterium]